MGKVPVDRERFTMVVIGRIVAETCFRRMVGMRSRPSHIGSSLVFTVYIIKLLIKLFKSYFGLLLLSGFTKHTHGTMSAICHSFQALVGVAVVASTVLVILKWRRRNKWRIHFGGTVSPGFEAVAEAFR